MSKSDLAVESESVFTFDTSIIGKKCWVIKGRKPVETTVKRATVIIDEHGESVRYYVEGKVKGMKGEELALDIVKAQEMLFEKLK